jgi:hypothetical protein
MAKQTKEEYNAILRARYKRLKAGGATTAQAKKYRKYEDSAIDQVIEVIKKGMGESLPIPDYYKPKEKKKTGKKEPKKKKTKTGVEYPEAPPGYYYAYYKKSGNFVLKKKPGAKEPDKIGENKSGYPKLMIFVKDQTDRINAGDFIGTQIENLEKSRAELVEDMKAEINAPRDSGTIGRTRVIIASNDKEEAAFLRQYSEWALIYDETPEYKSVLAATATVVSSTYERWRKESYVSEIINYTDEINKKIARKLREDKII